MRGSPIPRPLGPMLQHYWLVQRMARANGTDLAEASRRGRLEQSDWANMVQRCRGCAWAGGCQRWLARAERVGAGGNTPEPCVNRACFDTLRAGQAAP